MGSQLGTKQLMLSRREHGDSPGPVSELFSMEVVQLHPASPALLPAPGQQLLTIPGCFPLLLLFGCRELFWSRDVNTESGPTAGCCEVESGQAVSSVRREVSRGSCVLLPPESTSPGSRCSARSRVRGSMGGGPWARRA